MKKLRSLSIAAALPAATIVVSLLCASCEGRKMSNMVPKGETVEVNVDAQDSIPADSTAAI